MDTKGGQISLKSVCIKKCVRFYEVSSKCEVEARNVGAGLSTYTCPFINGPWAIRWKRNKKYQKSTSSIQRVRKDLSRTHTFISFARYSLINQYGESKLTVNIHFEHVFVIINNIF